MRLHEQLSGGTDIIIWGAAVLRIHFQSFLNIFKILGALKLILQTTAKYRAYLLPLSNYLLMDVE